MSVSVDDLFCGAGGSSLGAELAGARLRLGLNHWDRAVETHATNFQHADHDCADISALTTSQIGRYISGSELLIAGLQFDQGGCFVNGTVASTPNGISCLPTPTPWLAPWVLIRSSPDLASPAELSLVNRVTDRC